jgi:hypothetical protein
MGLTLFSRDRLDAQKLPVRPSPISSSSVDPPDAVELCNGMQRLRGRLRARDET